MTIRYFSLKRLNRKRLITNEILTDGELTVRTSASYFADCYDEDKITIRAVPVAVTNSVAKRNVEYFRHFYGGEWCHTFSSTGGAALNPDLGEAFEIKEWSHVLKVSTDELGYLVFDETGSTPCTE